MQRKKRVVGTVKVRFLSRVHMSKSPTAVPRCLSGILELTHNHGTETLETTPYRSGNEEPKGFGHIAITVPDVEAACARFERLGVTFKKRLKDGKMNFLAFILDPDGYWIEVVRLRVSLRLSTLTDEYAQLSTSLQLQHRGI